VGQLVSGVAHELNNPSPRSRIIRVLQERPAMPEAERTHLRVIQEQAERPAESCATC